MAGEGQSWSKARIFKVVKTPVSLERHPAEIQPLLGDEFYVTDPQTGRDLVRNGYEVLPEQPLPLVADELSAFVQADGITFAGRVPQPGRTVYLRLLTGVDRTSETP